MKFDLKIVLILFIPNVITTPFENIDKNLNIVDHRNTEDRIELKQNNESETESKTEETIVVHNLLEKNEENPLTRSHVTWLISPITQKVQLSSHSMLRDRLNSLKKTFTSPAQQNMTAKNLSSGLLQMVGLNDAELLFTANEPVGILGGNGWFANKGGILGGPGAILSTGSLLTDYPTAYKK